MHWHASTNWGHAFAFRAANGPLKDLAVFWKKAFSRVLVRPLESNSTSSRWRFTKSAYPTVARSV